MIVPCFSVVTLLLITRTLTYLLELVARGRGQHEMHLVFVVAECTTHLQEPIISSSPVLRAFCLLYVAMGSSKLVCGIALLMCIVSSHHGSVPCRAAARKQLMWSGWARTYRCRADCINPNRTQNRLSKTGQRVDNSRLFVCCSSTSRVTCCAEDHGFRWPFWRLIDKPDDRPRHG